MDTKRIGDTLFGLFTVVILFFVKVVARLWCLVTSHVWDDVCTGTDIECVECKRCGKTVGPEISCNSEVKSWREKVSDRISVWRALGTIWRIKGE